MIPHTLKVKSWDEKNVIYLLKEKYNSRILNTDTIVIMMLGNVMPVETSTNGETEFYTVIFDVLLFSPQIGEIVPSSVLGIGKSEMAVWIGSLEAYVHKSHILDGKPTMDVFSQTATANGKLIKKETVIRGRITSVSIPHTGRIRIGMTCTQKHLGLLEEK